VKQKDFDRPISAAIAESPPPQKKKFFSADKFEHQMNFFTSIQITDFRLSSYPAGLLVWSEIAISGARWNFAEFKMMILQLREAASQK